MFYLLRGVPLPDIEVGQRVIVLADFSGIPAGTRGTIKENYRTGVMVEWDVKTCLHTGVCDCPGAEPNQWGKPLADGFGADELEYLAFETARHPWKAIAEPRLDN